MKQGIVKLGLAVALVLVCFGTGVYAAAPTVGVPKDSWIVPSEAPQPVARPFKLKGGGAIDLTTFAFTFAGQATHLGQFTANGQLDPSTFQIAGTMTAANGDTLNWVAAFTTGPLGEIEATFSITGGTGRFENASGTAAGPVALDPDFLFTIDLDGTINY